MMIGSFFALKIQSLFLNKILWKKINASLKSIKANTKRNTKHPYICLKADFKSHRRRFFLNLINNLITIGVITTIKRLFKRISLLTSPKCTFTTLLIGNVVCISLIKNDCKYLIINK